MVSFAFVAIANEQFCIHWSASKTLPAIRLFLQLVLPISRLGISVSLVRPHKFIPTYALLYGGTVLKIRPANLRVGQLCEIVNGAIFGSMITYMRLVKMGQKSQAFLTQMVQFWWGNYVNNHQLLQHSSNLY